MLGGKEVFEVKNLSAVSTGVEKSGFKIWEVKSKGKVIVESILST